MNKFLAGLESKIGPKSGFLGCGGFSARRVLGASMAFVVAARTPFGWHQKGWCLKQVGFSTLSSQVFEVEDASRIWRETTSEELLIMYQLCGGRRQVSAWASRMAPEDMPVDLRDFARLRRRELRLQLAEVLMAHGVEPEELALLLPSSRRLRRAVRRRLRSEAEAAAPWGRAGGTGDKNCA